jgi:hypothetical protein
VCYLVIGADVQAWQQRPGSSASNSAIIISLCRFLPHD